jgi:hypothetical protein
MIKTLFSAVILLCFVGITHAQMASKWNITDTNGNNLKIEMGKVKDISVPVYILDSKSGGLNIDLYYMGSPDLSTKRFLQVMPADDTESNYMMDLTQATERSMSTSIPSSKIQEITKSKSIGTIYKVREVIEGGEVVDVKTIFHFKLK